MQHKAPILTAVAFAIFQLLIPSAAHSNGEFFQLDVSAVDVGAVAAINRGQVGAHANYTVYEGGRSFGFSITYARELEKIGTLRFGPSLGISSSDLSDDKLTFGGKVVVERWRPTDFGHLFLLGEINSIENNWFALAQIGVDSPRIAFEISAGGSSNYKFTKLTALRRIGDSPIFFRGGYNFVEDTVFFGMSINTF